MIKKKAYLMVTLKEMPGLLMPAVYRVGIYSDRILTARNGETDALILEMEDDTYQNARDSIYQCVKGHPGFMWMLPWLDASKEAHNALFLLQRAHESKFR